MSNQETDPRGLYGKYIIHKAETGEPLDGLAFVLRYDRDPAARRALAFYADLIAESNAALYVDLRAAIIDVEINERIGAERARLAEAGYRVEPDDTQTVAYAPDGSVVWTELTFPFSEAEDQIICWEKCAQHAREVGR